MTEYDFYKLLSLNFTKVSLRCRHASGCFPNIFRTALYQTTLDGPYYIHKLLCFDNVRVGNRIY